MIIIVGCARSGTTLTASVLQACGANFGEVDRLMEHKIVRSQIVRPYLAQIGASTRGVNPLPRRDSIVYNNDWGDRVRTAIGQPEPWAYKCPKSCHIWPLWDHHFPKAKWVIVQRAKEQIVSSCMRTSFMQGFNDEEGWGAWVDVHHKRFKEIRSATDSMAVWPQRTLDMPEAFIPLVEHCGLTWNGDEVAKRIDPSLWHV